MKQTKWQRLATIGLCSSLVINAFSGVTAVAETITIESSPTVASSAKEATSASSATQASTESSQETTETSREEVTQETEKPEVVKEETQTEAKKQEEETVTSEVVQPNPVLAPTPVSGIGVRAGNLDSFYQLTKTQMLNYSWSTTKVFSVPALKMVFDIKGSGNELVNTNDFKLTAEIRRAIFYNGTGQYSKVISDSTPIITKESGNITIDIPAIELPLEGRTRNYYYLNNINFETPKYIKNIEIKGNLLSFKNQGTTGAFGEIPSDTTIIVTKESENLYSINSAREVYYTGSVWTLGKIPVIFFASTGPDAVYKQFLEFPSENPTVNVDFKKVTESFKDTAGATIPAPTGFTQGKQTSITSNNYTFKQAGTLPETYKASNGKTYKFKGWYKGKTKPSTLTTTKAPSYAVTYDDNDDLNVVYEEETVTMLYPTMNVNFVDEKGVGFTPALTFSGKYYAQSTSASLRTDLYDVTSKNNGNGQYTISVNNGSMPLSQELLKKYNNGQPIGITSRLQFNVDKLTIDQQLKYVDSIQVDTAQSRNLKSYRHEHMTDNSLIFDPNVPQSEADLRSEYVDLFRFNSDGTYFSNASNRFFNMHLGYSSTGVNYLLVMILFNANPVNPTKLVYTVTRKQVTENFVDTNGTKITPPTGFTQGNQIPMTSNTFKYTATRALPASYTTGGKTYIFQGWYKGKTKPNTLTTSTTPTYNTTFDGNDDMTAMYKEEVPKASVALTRTTAETVTSGGNVTWRATITNTSQAPLTTATIKKSTAWTTGLAAPTAMIVTPAGGTAKTVPVTATTWTNGVSLGTDIPVGKSATVQFTTKATGTAGQVLRAGVTTSGNYSGVSASATVRVKDNDQAIVTPTAEGFISVPTFNFGQVGVAGSTQQHGLKEAADYYGNGTRNPYLRIKKTQPNWSLTAQLSQPKSATDSLPTATRLLLGAAPVSSFSNYNQPTELKSAVGTTSTISLNANNTATRIIANQQFTGSNIYQLDFTFNNVKLEVPANQGVKGQQYQAAVTWNLVTGP
ncbi:hypothetical protein EB37_02403 [Enterococcus faecalis]|uniref:WxL domain-containing protein n=2 Tax=Bacteria TaxID=2 RepID=UPI000DE8CD4A|nr:WxL domain-containing protein [Enterococcus faecalis]RBR56330.1 hypothetical protein EB37_02403 [Enterococcus faecalis]